MDSFTISLILILSSLMAALTGSAQPTPQNQRGFLATHNAARSAVGVGPLVWNETLAIYARNYAQRRLSNCQLIHSGGPYGENLAAGSGVFSPRDAVGLWVNERSNYNYSRNTCVGGECRHYTQVVWRNSRNVGCARLRCRNGWWFVICNYSPPGNYIGQRPY